MSPSARLRRAVAQSLGKWEKGHLYAETLVADQAKRLELSPSDRALFNAILLGVLRNLRLLDHWIQSLRKSGKLDSETRNLLRTGLCQLLILDLPEHAAINETVSASPPQTRGLTNGVLRSAQREKDSLLAQGARLSPAVRLSHPDWLVNRWTTQFGEEDCCALLAWNQEPSKTYARLNPLKPSLHADILNSEKTTPLSGNESFLQIQGFIPREWTESGAIYIQDPATRHCIDLLAPQPGETIIDACAAPGGKAALTGAAMENQGRLICSDSNQKRLPRLQDNLQNLGISIAETHCHDWTLPCPNDLRGRADAILLDVPCSNTGVLRRRVDARWRLTPESFSNITVIQKKILQNAIATVKPGGRIVYSTCSIDAEENSHLIQDLLTKNPQLSLERETAVFPFSQQTDGAYAALLRV